MGIIKRVVLGAVHGAKNLWQSFTANPITAVPETVEIEPSEVDVVMDDLVIGDASDAMSRSVSTPSHSSKGSGAGGRERKGRKTASAGRKVRQATGRAVERTVKKTAKKKTPVSPASSVVVVPAKKGVAKRSSTKKTTQARRPKKPSVVKKSVGKGPTVKISVVVGRTGKKRAPTAKRVAGSRGTAAKRRAKVSAATRRTGPAKNSPRFERNESNPLMEPVSDRYWESKAVFNPAAAILGGKVHVLYRAIGDDDLSVLGYASSKDGFTIDERSKIPAYICGYVPVAARETAAPVFYGSGGGWNGGCEDPRLTFVGGRGYLLFTAFDGWGSVRIGISSISEKDFLAKRWNWRQRALISPPGEIHKNWVLFPEKINGKFAILHSISPRVRVAYVDDLDAFAKKGKFIKSKYEKSSRRRAWDSWVRGAGPPPIKTDKGWLLLYHAMDDRDPGRYKLGAMLLDRKDPTKVVARSKEPILEPDEWYENQGFKSGVVYCCGAVVKAGRLIVYYGGADTVVCAAEMPLKALVNALVSKRSPKLRKSRTVVKRKKNGHH